MQFKTNLVVDAPNIKIGPSSARFEPQPESGPSDPIRNDYKAKWYAGGSTGQVANGYQAYPRDETFSDGAGPKISIWPWNSDRIVPSPTFAAEYEVSYDPPLRVDPSVGGPRPYGRHTETIIIASDPLLWT